MRILLVGESQKFPDIKDALARNSIYVQTAYNLDSLNRKLKDGNFTCAIFDSDAVSGYTPSSRRKILSVLKRWGKGYIFVTSRQKPDIIHEAKAMGAKDLVFRPYNDREFILRINACCQGKRKISCIGGGTGLFNLLSGLKRNQNVLLTSIVSMTDDGGSTGRLRSSFGILPPGDVRMSLVALSNAPALMDRLLQYRFASGGKCFVGHNLGNIVLLAMSEISGSMKEGIKNLGGILNIQGLVIPVTTTNSTLNAIFENGTVIKGETNIDLGKGRDPALRIKRIWHEPKTISNPDAYASIIFADAVIIGPGDLYTSVITNLIVGNIRKAIAETSAKKIYICNLMTKPGETSRYGAFEHVRDVVKYLSGPYLDYIIISNTKFTRAALNRYAEKGQFPVRSWDIAKINKLIKRAKVVCADVGDTVDLIRHDTDKIKGVIENIAGAKRPKA